MRPWGLQEANALDLKCVDGLIISLDFTGYRRHTELRVTATAMATAIAMATATVTATVTVMVTLTVILTTLHYVALDISP